MDCCNPRASPTFWDLGGTQERLSFSIETRNGYIHLSLYWVHPFDCSSVQISNPVKWSKQQPAGVKGRYLKKKKTANQPKYIFLRVYRKKKNIYNLSNSFLRTTIGLTEADGKNKSLLCKLIRRRASLTETTNQTSRQVGHAAGYHMVHYASQLRTGTWGFRPQRQRLKLTNKRLKVIAWTGECRHVQRHLDRFNREPREDSLSRWVMWVRVM